MLQGLIRNCGTSAAFTRQSGTIKWFDQSKGHGWITPETGHDTNAPLHFFLCLKNPRGYQGVTIRAFPRRL
ncbi:cold-shock protein, partial [Pseudomonas aeruginosa]|nr:cold-shock protein [Pseudomonas aeruginosa]